MEVSNDKIFERVVDVVNKVAETAKDVERIEKTSANHIHEINRRLESIQDNNIVSNKAILEKVGDITKISNLEIKEFLGEKIELLLKSVQSNLRDNKEYCEVENKKFEKEINAINRKIWYASGAIGMLMLVIKFY